MLPNLALFINKSFDNTLPIKSAWVVPPRAAAAVAPALQGWRNIGHNPRGILETLRRAIPGVARSVAFGTTAEAPALTRWQAAYRPATLLAQSGLGGLGGNMLDDTIHNTAGIRTHQENYPNTIGPLHEGLSDALSAVPGGRHLFATAGAALPVLGRASGAAIAPRLPAPRSWLGSAATSSAHSHPAIFPQRARNIINNAAHANLMLQVAPIASPLAAVHAMNRAVPAAADRVYDDIHADYDIDPRVHPASARDQQANRLRAGIPPLVGRLQNGQPTPGFTGAPTAVNPGANESVPTASTQTSATPTAPGGTPRVLGTSSVSDETEEPNFLSRMYNSVPNAGRAGLLGLGAGLAAHGLFSGSEEDEEGNKQTKRPWLGPLVGLGAAGLGAGYLSGWDPSKLTDMNWWKSSSHHPLILVPHRIKFANIPGLPNIGSMMPGLNSAANIAIDNSPPIYQNQPIPEGLRPNYRMTPPPAQSQQNLNTLGAGLMGGTNPFAQVAQSHAADMTNRGEADRRNPLYAANSLRSDIDMHRNQNTGRAVNIASQVGLGAMGAMGGTTPGQTASTVTNNNTTPWVAPGQRDMSNRFSDMSQEDYEHGHALLTEHQPHATGDLEQATGRNPITYTTDPENTNPGTNVVINQAQLSRLANRAQELNPAVNDRNVQLQNIHQQLGGGDSPGIWQRVMAIWEGASREQKVLLGAGLGLGLLGLINGISGGGMGSYALAGMGGLAAAYGAGAFNSDSPLRQMFSGTWGPDQPRPAPPQAINTMNASQLGMRDIGRDTVAQHIRNIQAGGPGAVASTRFFAQMAPDAQEAVQGMFNDNPQVQQLLSNDVFGPSGTVNRFMQEHNQSTDNWARQYAPNAQLAPAPGQPGQATSQPGAAPDATTQPAGSTPSTAAQPNPTQAAPQPQSAASATPVNLNQYFTTNQANEPTLTVAGARLLFDPAQNSNLQRMYSQLPAAERTRLVGQLPTLVSKLSDARFALATGYRQADATAQLTAMGLDPRQINTYLARARALQQQIPTWPTQPPQPAPAAPPQAQAPPSPQPQAAQPQPQAGPGGAAQPNPTNGGPFPPYTPAPQNINTLTNLLGTSENPNEVMAYLSGQGNGAGVHPAEASAALAQTDRNILMPARNTPLEQTAATAQTAFSNAHAVREIMGNRLVHNILNPANTPEARQSYVRWAADNSDALTLGSIINQLHRESSSPAMSMMNPANAGQLTNINSIVSQLSQRQIERINSEPGNPTNVLALQQLLTSGRVDPRHLLSSLSPGARHVYMQAFERNRTNVPFMTWPTITPAQAQPPTSTFRRPPGFPM